MKIISYRKARILLFISFTLSLTIPSLYTLAQEPADSYAGVMPTSLRRPLDAYGKGPFCTSCHNMMYPLPPEDLAVYAGEVVESTEMEPGLKRLTWDLGRDVGAFYSPKGDKIIWVTDRFVNWTIWVMNGDGSGKKQLTSESVISGWPSWSPDGQEITYWSWDPATNSCDIWKMMADGSSKVQLTTDGNLKGAPKWSSKGDRIAYTSELTGDMEVYVMNEDGSQQRQITEGHSPENFVETQIIWHPDGERLYWKVCIFPLPPFTTTIIPDDVAFVEIHMINVDTCNDRILTPKLHEAIHSVSEDGKKIAFISLRSPNYGLWVMDYNGSGQNRLTWDGQGDRAPQISPNGKTIVYWSLAHGFQPDIWLINIDGSDKTRLTKSTYHDVYPSWNPDGNKILFESDRAGNYDIFQISLDSFIDVDVEFEGCATSGSVSKAFITIKPSIKAKSEIKVEKVELRFDWNNESEYIENLITVPYTLSDQNELYQTEIDFSVPEDTKLGYHFYDVKVQYSEVDGKLKTYEHSAGDLMLGTLEQYQCEVLRNELEIKIAHLNDKAKREGYFEYLLKPENEYFTKACDEYNLAQSLMMKGDYDTAKYHLERAKNILNQSSSETSISGILDNWLIMVALIPIIVAIFLIFWLPYAKKMLARARITFIRSLSFIRSSLAASSGMVTI